MNRDAVESSSYRCARSGKVIAVLQIEPELRLDREVPTEAQGRISRNAQLFPCNTLNACARDTASFRHPIGGQLQRDKELLPQDFTRVKRRQRRDDLNLLCHGAYIDQ